jgi:uncharacterized protein (UPF0264 family)
MRLLVSVRNATEAEAALEGGADIVDAKEPVHGALGRVTDHVLKSIGARVAGRAPVSVALGDVGSDHVAEGAAAASRAGAAFVKIGFAGCGRSLGADDLRTAVDAIGSTTLVLVAYADYDRADAPLPEEVVSLAHETRAAGILLDTFDKHGPGLTALMTLRALSSFVSTAQSAGQFVAVAGRLTIQDIEQVWDTSADIVGIRGAACEGGRNGIVAVDRVRMIRRYLDSKAELVFPTI